jgi:signal transduction histidine kinase
LVDPTNRLRPAIRRRASADFIESTGNRVFSRKDRKRILSASVLASDRWHSASTNHLNQRLALPWTLAQEPKPSVKGHNESERDFRPRNLCQHREPRMRNYAFFLLDGLAGWIGKSLTLGENAIVIATHQHREGVHTRLKASGVDLDLAVEQQRYLALDAADTLSTFMVDSQPDACRFAEGVGRILCQGGNPEKQRHRRINIFGEMVALLWADAKVDAAIRLEQLWNELAKRHDFSLACAYPTNFFDRPEHAQSFLKICAGHSAVIPDESYTALSDDDERLRAIAALQQKARALDTEVRDHKRLQQELQSRGKERTVELEQAQDRLRGLSRRLLRMQDEERRRIAFELHDSTAQLLAALAINVGLLEKHKGTLGPGHADLISENSALVQQLLSEVRALSYTLHPPTLDVIGVASALQWYVDQFQEHCRVRVTLEVPGNLGRLPREIEIAIFRIVQESLANVYRHSGSASATVRISRLPTEIILAVSDRGKGLSPEKRETLSSELSVGAGVSGMRERAQHLDGTFALLSDSTGTTVLVNLPVKE